MSNANNPTGLSPVCHINGAPWNGATRRCWIAASHSGSLFVGDPVVLEGSADPTTGAYPTVSIATAGTGNPIFGVITSFHEDPTNLESKYWLTGTATGRFCYVCCDPTVLYEVQGDSTAVATYTDVGANANLSSSTAGSSTTGLSGWQMATTSMTTTSTYQVRIMGAVDRPDNDITAAYAKWLVLINLNQLWTPASNASAGSTYIGSLGV